MLIDCHVKVATRRHLKQITRHKVHLQIDDIEYFVDLVFDTGRQLSGQFVQDIGAQLFDDSIVCCAIVILETRVPVDVRERIILDGDEIIGRHRTHLVTVLQKGSLVLVITIARQTIAHQPEDDFSRQRIDDMQHGRVDLIGAQHATDRVEDVLVQQHACLELFHVHDVGVKDVGERTVLAMVFLHHAARDEAHYDNVARVVAKFRLDLVVCRHTDNLQRVVVHDEGVWQL